MCEECREIENEVEEFEENRKEEKVREVFTDYLPKWESGTNKGKINWKESVNYKVKFIYDDIQGEVEILDYNGKSRYLSIKYKSKEPFKIKTNNFRNCLLGELLKEELYTYTYDETNPRRVDLRNLPLNGQGIDWSQVANDKMKILFIYDDIVGEVHIIKYDGKFLSIKYKDKKPFKINTGSFTRCMLGKLLNKYTNEFKIKIGTNFKDNKRDLTIVNREYRKNKDGRSNRKYYRYHCNKCGYDEGWIVESQLLKGGNCACCSSYRKIPVLGINTIWDTDRWMCDLGVSEEDAKKYTKASNDKITVICPDCGRKKETKIADIYMYHSIACNCGDGQSYPNKLCYALLKQLNIEFDTEFAPNWCKYNFKGKQRQGRYDFFVKVNKNNKMYKYIIEMDGEFHFKDNDMNGQTAGESRFFDNEKDRLANEHDIKVIRIDSQISNLDYIKNNILDKLSNLFDLSAIDWDKCQEYALSNLCKKTCKIKYDNPNMSTIEIGIIMNLTSKTIREYLKKGVKLRWCNYNPKEELIKNNSQIGKANGKPVEIFKNGISLGIFDSCHELERQSEERFGVKLHVISISKVCRGLQYTCGGFTFKYID